MALTLSGSGQINGLTLPTDSLQAGLVLVNKTDFSSAASVSINNCFSSLYDNYKIVMFNVASVDQNILLRLRNGGTDKAGSVYNTQRLLADVSTVSTAALDAQTAWFPGLTYNAQNHMTVDVILPFASGAATTFSSQYFYSYYNATGISGGIYTTADSNDGFTIYPGSGTITGTIRVYGYRNA